MATFLAFATAFYRVGLWPRLKNAAVGPTQFGLSFFKKRSATNMFRKRGHSYTSSRVLQKHGLTL